jgi:predicted AAA+ superfamily ATPase
VLKSQREGSPLSYGSLAQDLQIAFDTVKKYLAILENLYIVFLIRPLHKNSAL